MRNEKKLTAIGKVCMGVGVGAASLWILCVSAASRTGLARRKRCQTWAYGGFVRGEL